MINWDEGDESHSVDPPACAQQQVPQEELSDSHIENLEDLLSLHDDGENVLLPAGLSVSEARHRVANRHATRR